MAKKIKIVKSINGTINYVCPPGYAARVEWINGEATNPAISVVDLITGSTTFSVTPNTNSVNSDVIFLGSPIAYVALPSYPGPEYILISFNNNWYGIKKIFYLDGGAGGERFTMTNSGTSRLLVIEEEHNNQAAGISITPNQLGYGGGTVTGVVTTYGYPNGSTLYWAWEQYPMNENYAQYPDFTPNSGTVSINNNSAVINSTASTSGFNVELQEVYRIILRDTPSGPPIGQSNPITLITYGP
jgi:hypothetical protein